MLGKLLKYEFKATGRVFLPFYLALLGFALINRLVSFDLMARLEPSILTSQLGVIAVLVKIIYFVLIVAVVVSTALIMVQRFHKSLLGDEGYLMFTLPVHTWQHIVSKLIVAACWTVASALITLGSIAILSATDGFWPVLGEALTAFKDIFGVSGIFVFLLTVLAAMLSGILMIYAAITLGHLASKLRLLASFAWYCALYFVTSALLTAIIAPLVPGYIDRFSQAVFPVELLMQVILRLALLPALVLGFVCFALTYLILNRRLNLE